MQKANTASVNLAKPSQQLFAVFLLAITTTGFFCVHSRAETSSLPSWNEGSAKQAIIGFVQNVTNKTSEQYIPPENRIAVFDNDGTLWPSHPMYTQLAFAIDRVNTLAPQHPEWKQKQPFAALLNKDYKALAAAAPKEIAQIIAATHAGMSVTRFESIVADWFKTARHPRFKKRYTELAYQPMLEMLDYLRKNQFTIYIVSGGGIEFIRPIAQAVYGIPPEQVIGSSIETKYEQRNGKPVLMRQAEIDFISDKEGKPVAINTFIGKRPVIAVGNSDGDRQMLQWISSGSELNLAMLVLHDDERREYAYGPANGLPDTRIGSFSESLLKEAEKENWIVISMKKDWKRIFSFDP